MKLRFLDLFTFACCVVVPALVFGAEATRSQGSTHRYTMAHGQGWSVCEAYFKFLNTTPKTEEPPLCNLKVGRVPGMQEPKWEVLDVQQNLRTVHQIELILGRGRITPAPDPDFDLWRTQFQERIQAQQQKPRLRRVRLALVPSGPVESLLSYDVDTGACEKEVSKAKQAMLYDIWLDWPSFFVFNEATQQVMGRDYWRNYMQGTLWLHGGRPYYFTRHVGEPKNGSEINIYIKRIEPVDPADTARKFSLPGEPPYNARELCLIQFKYPFPPTRD